MKKNFSKLYLYCSIIFLTLSLPVVLFFQWVHSPVNQTQGSMCYIPEGSSVTYVANALYEHKALTHPKLFKIYVKILGAEKKIKFGTFVFNAQNSPADILNKLMSGDSIKVKIVIPEGLNIYQISDKLAGYFPQYPSKDWLNLMSDQHLIRQLPFTDPAIKTVEGFLFPNTYFFDPNEHPIHVLKTLIAHFKQVVTSDMLTKARTLGLKPLEYLTLASIVQKESAVETELNEISSIFFNRLRIKMKLQSDPTVIYGVWHDYKGKITKKHLRTSTEYNTYVKYGLPVGPITNPGLLSLQAVLNPAQSKNLYFVAAGDGRHTFSESYKTHRKAVKRYIRSLRAYAR